MKNKWASFALPNEKSILDEKVALGSISKQQELDQLTQLSSEEYNIEYQSLAAEAANDNLSVVEKQKVYDQIAILYQKHQNDLAAIDRKAVQDQSHQYDAMFKSIQAGPPTKWSTASCRARRPGSRP